MFEIGKSASLCWVVGVACAWAGWAAATPPALDAPPDDATSESGAPAGGYRRTVELFRTEANLRNAGVELAPTIRPFSGDREIPVLCVAFDGMTPTFQPADYERLLFDPPGDAPFPPQATLTQYYRDISQGVLVPRGDAYGWYPLPRNDAHYEGGNNGSGEPIGELLQSAFEQAVAAGVDFGLYDNDGEDGVPNSGDDDGLVDVVFVVHPEVGGECRGGGGNIHSHRAKYSRWLAGGKRPFVTTSRRKAGPGEHLTGDDAFIQIEDYTIQPGLSCESRPGSEKIVEIGVFCHEYGHALLLPDLYDRTYKSQGLGRWCLMSAGNRGAPINGRADCPVHMSAWCKARLGWADLTILAADGPVEFEPVEAANRVYCIDVPNTDGQEYFLLEYRDANWSDPDGLRLNWDRQLPSSGIAIWHIDESVGRSATDPSSWPFAKKGAGQNDAPSFPNGDGSGFRSQRALVSLIQPDKQLHLERRAVSPDGAPNEGDSGDLFDADDVFDDDPTHRGGSRSYRSGRTGISVKSIDLTARTAHLAGFSPTAPSVGAIAAGDVAGSAGEAAPLPPGPPPADTPLDSAPLEQTQQQRTQQSVQQQIQSSRSKGALFEEKIRGARDRAADIDLSKFSKQDLELFDRADDRTLRESLPAKDVVKLREESAARRTYELTKGSAFEGPLGEAAANFIDASETPNASVRVNPRGDAVQQIVGIEIPSRAPELAQDADLYVKEGLGSLIGGASPDLQVAMAPEVGAKEGTVRYQQVIDVDGQKIPLHCYGVSFHYEDGKLVDLQSNVLSTDIVTVSGKTPDAPAQERIAALAKQLRVPTTRLSDGGQCIYFVAGNPGAARVAARYELSVGELQKNIEILVDGETGDFVKAK